MNGDYDNLFKHFSKHIRKERLLSIQKDVLADVYGIRVDETVSLKFEGVTRIVKCRVLEELTDNFQFKVQLLLNGSLYKVWVEVVSTDADDYLGVRIVKHHFNSQS